MYAMSDRGPVALIDTDQSEEEQTVAVYHEILHHIGLTDEKLVEEIAQKLAKAAPELLKIVRWNT